MLDLRKNETKEDLLDKIKEASFGILTIGIERLTDEKKKEEKKEIILQNFIKEITPYDSFNYFKKMNQKEQIQALIDTGFLIIKREQTNPTTV